MDYEEIVVSNSIGKAVDWIKETLSLTKKQYWMFFMFFIIAFVVSMIVGVIPILGILNIPIGAIFAGGYAFCAYKADQGHDVYIEDFFSSFRRRMWDYLKIVLILCGVGLLLIFPLLILGGTFAAIGVSNQETLMAALNQPIGVVLAGLTVIVSLVTALVCMAMLYVYSCSIVIVTLHDLSVKESLLLALSGCKKNFLTYVFHLILWIFIYIIAAIPLGLGLIILIPTVVTGSYVIYKNSFKLPVSVLITSEEEEAGEETTV
ncbi:BPSS1780 family membrane protein [Bacteriovorax sp. Seq25_V]|uniref:BPSS1780 family membrane protein n=1 Tax=Bacteriovorax sp. Seq25_V TaxID=1201288 RepID=UPI000389FBAA|nr:BPSS1780 family membrane protein [Bacteriovorax sp. Seq25_V]EQC44813.1 hypothetical protein M900_0390 [Bacteriovorax sp. Seq25_V]